MPDVNNVDIFKLQLNDGKLNMQGGDKDKNSHIECNELLKLIQSLMGNDYDRLLASNKKYVDPVKELYFEISLDQRVLKLVERSSVKRQEYEIDLETKKVLFNHTEVAPSFIEDIAVRLRKYAEMLKSDPKVSVVGVKRNGDERK